jgi:transposase
MNLQQEGTVRSRRTREEVRQLVSAFPASGLRAREFCQQHGLALSTLRRHLSKPGGAQTKAAAGVRFVAVTLNGAPGPATEQAAPAGLELLLAGGRRIAVGPGFDVATLGRLVRALEGL